MRRRIAALTGSSGVVKRRILKAHVCGKQNFMLNNNKKRENLLTKYKINSTLKISNLFILIGGI
jgi:hypothetical protein